MATQVRRPHRSRVRNRKSKDPRCSRANPPCVDSMPRWRQQHSCGDSRPRLSRPRRLLSRRSLSATLASRNSPFPRYADTDNHPCAEATPIVLVGIRIDIGRIVVAPPWAIPVRWPIPKWIPAETPAKTEAEAQSPAAAPASSPAAVASITPISATPPVKATAPPEAETTISTERIAGRNSRVRGQP